MCMQLLKSQTPWQTSPLTITPGLSVSSNWRAPIGSRWILFVVVLGHPPGCSYRLVTPLLANVQRDHGQACDTRTGADMVLTLYISPLDPERHYTKSG